MSECLHLTHYPCKFEWHSNVTHKPKKEGEYLCKVVYFNFNDKITVSFYRYEIRRFTYGIWLEEGYNGGGILAWAEIPNCTFYVDDSELNKERE